MDYLTTDDYVKILNARFPNNNFKFIKADLTPISENMEGFLGEHFNLIIHYKFNDKTLYENFFYKRKLITKKKDDSAYSDNVFKKEIFVYEYLLKEYEKYGYDVSFSPKCYYSIPDKVLVLDNLKLNGYALPERHEMFNMEQIQSTIKSLASLHASSIAYEKTKSKELNKPYSIGNEFPDEMEEKIYTMYYKTTKQYNWNNTYNIIYNIIDLFPQDDNYKQELKNLIKEYPFGKSLVTETGLMRTFGHGDIWTNNLLMKRVNGVIDCKLVDYQFCRYFYPCFDILFAIYTITTANLRKEHLNEIYHYYYETLKQFLNNYGYSIENILPLDDFHRSIELCKIDAVSFSVETIIIVYLPKEKLTEFFKKGEEFTDNIDTYKIAYRNDEKYRRAVTEIIEEFREMLLETKFNSEEHEKL